MMGGGYERAALDFFSIRRELAINCDVVLARASPSTRLHNNGKTMPSAKAQASPDKSKLQLRMTSAQQQPADAEALLKADHRKVETLFQQFKSADAPEEKARLARQVCKELLVHTKLEEELFYPACREKGVDDETLDEAQVEHDGVKVLVAELLRGSPDDDYYEAKVAVLSEYVKHHVAEEEKARNGILARAKKGGVDMNALGRKIQERKVQILADIDERRLAAPTLLAARSQSGSRSTYEQDEMTRNPNESERDELGRFTGEDGGRARSASYSRGREYDKDEDYRRVPRSRLARWGWYGDSEEHSEASERGWEGHSSRRGPRSLSRDSDEDTDYRDGSSDDRGGGGWFGDPEGHSEASEKGWERRLSSRGDSQSRGRDYNNESHYRRGSKGSRHGGWYGDPEGHSKASERGWEDRTSRSREHEGGGETRRESRGRAQGGWYGDPRGHAEAARRGWEDRD